MTTLREEIFDLLQAEQLLHQALQRILSWLAELTLLLERALRRLRQSSTGRLRGRWRQHHGSARTGLFSQQLSLQLLRLIMRHRHQLRGFHAHRGGGSSGGGSGGSHVTQLRMLLRMMMMMLMMVMMVMMTRCGCWQAGRLAGETRKHTDVRQPANRGGASRGG